MVLSLIALRTPFWSRLALTSPLFCVVVQEKRSVIVAVRTRPTAVFAQDQVLLDLENQVNTIRRRNRGCFPSSPRPPWVSMPFVVSGTHLYKYDLRVLTMARASPFEGSPRRARAVRHPTVKRTGTGSTTTSCTTLARILCMTLCVET